MSDPPLAQWDHALFQDIQLLLRRVALAPTTSIERALNKKLEEARPWFLSLASLPGPSDRDRQRVEKDGITLQNGDVINIHGEYLSAANDISELLSVSQLLAAHLVYQAEDARPRFPNRANSEIATYLVHEWSEQLLDVLRELLRLTIGPEVIIGRPFDSLREWVEELLNAKVAVGAGKGEKSMVDNIVARIDSLRTKIEAGVHGGRMGSIPYDLAVYRIRALRAEQGKLVGLLFAISEGGYVGRGHVITIIKWLKQMESPDPLETAVLSTFFAALKILKRPGQDAASPHYARNDVVEEWSRDIRFLKVVSKLVILDDWNVPRLREPAKLAWSLFLLEALRQADDIAGQLEIDNASAEAYLFQAISGEAFQYLRDLVIFIRQERGFDDSNEQSPEEQEQLSKSARQTDRCNDIYIFGELRHLVEYLADKKAIIKALRSREEDIAGRRSSSAPPQANYSAFLALVATVFRCLPPDSGSYMWRSTFMGMVLEPRAKGWPSPVYWELLTVLSTGKASASACFDRLRSHTFEERTWNHLFGFYRHYSEHAPHLHDPIKSSKTSIMGPMTAADIEGGKGFTSLLANVVRWSEVARDSFLLDKSEPVQLLFDFIDCDLPSELKATVLNAVTAFCAPVDGIPGDTALSKVMLHYERVSVIGGVGGFDSFHQDTATSPDQIGWILKMDYVEPEQMAYPLTRSYLDFLTALLPNRAAADRPANASRIRSSAAARRATTFVIDHVLLVQNGRDYTRHNERWEVLDSALAFLERSLLSFDMSELSVEYKSRPIGQVAAAMVDEPGFKILLRLLSEYNIFEVLSRLLDHTVALPIPRPPYMDSVLKRVLSIFHTVLTVQVVFSDVLLLALADPTTAPAQAFRRPSNMQSLDHYLLKNLSNVTSIALLVGDADLPVSFISTKIMAALAGSPVFSRTDVFRGEYSTSVNRLAGIIEASDDSIRIAQSFSNRLMGDGDDLSSTRLQDVEEKVLHGDVSSASLAALPLAIRSTILDILVDGTSAEAPGPNLAHFLLGFEFRSHVLTLQDPHSAESRISCFGSVLHQLNADTDSTGSASASLPAIHPTLAAKSAQLVFQLFAHPVTGRAAMSYASATADYSARQLASLPQRCTPSISEDEPGVGTVMYEGEPEIEATADDLISCLDYRRWVVSAAALEIFTYQGRSASSSDISLRLFGDSPLVDGDTRDPQIMRTAFIIDLLKSSSFLWKETPENVPASRPLEFYVNFNFDQFKRPDARWWDLGALRSAMVMYKRQRIRSSAVTLGTSAEAMTTEAEYIIQKVALENRQTEVSIAKGRLLGAWSELLEVSIAMLFSLVSDDRQDSVCFELLEALFAYLDHEQSPGALELACEAILVITSTMVNNLLEFDGTNLPVERLDINLRGMLDASLRTGMTESARGNLYAALNQYLQLLTIGGSGYPDDISIVASTVGRASVNGTGPLTLHKATISALAARKDRFFASLCRDAMDDREVWKTECFALLGAVALICHSDRDRQLLSPIMHGGLLPLFVRGIKDNEIALQESLSPDADNLHVFWVYEAKIAFLVAIAATQKGAEALLDAGVFETFAICGFLDAQPITEGTTGEAVLEEVMQRQHRVLVCSLQLLARTLSSLHKAPRTGAGHALSFLSAHRESILMIMRESAQCITLIGIEECRLLTSIFAMVAHKVPVEDFNSSSGFGAFHLSFVAVAARFFDRDAWQELFFDQGDLAAAEAQVMNLNQIVLVYLCAVTKELRSSTAYPVLVNGLHKSNGAGAAYMATTPSLQVAVQLLSDLTESVRELSSDYETVLDRVQNRVQIESSGVLKTRNADLFAEGVWSEDSAATLFAARNQMLFNMIESLLLLIWRHLLYYANDTRSQIDQVRPDNLSLSLPSFGSSQLNGSKFGGGSMRALARVASELRGVIDSLEIMEVHSDIRQSDAGKDKVDAYFDMLVRRLKELTAGLMGKSGEEA